MKNIKTLSIGIPAYNEAANIRNLLNSILNQIEKDYSLLEIIVISDGSTDNTASEVSKVESDKIRLINSKSRNGKSYRMNQILQMFEGDVLFLIDADVSIRDILLFTRIINNNDFANSGLIGINAKPNSAENIFQRTMNAGVIASEQISYDWNQGENYLSFKGCFLGLSKKFAKQLNLNSTIVNNDAYIYFKARSLGFKPAFYKNAQVYFKSPKYFKDYLSQSKRFTSSREEMQKIFNKDLSREYSIPLSIQMKAVLKNIITNPVLFSYFILIKSATLFAKPKNIKSTWNIAVSTK